MQQCGMELLLGVEYMLTDCEFVTISYPIDRRIKLEFKV